MLYLANVLQQIFGVERVHRVPGLVPNVCLGEFNMRLSFAFKLPGVALLSTLMIVSEAHFVKAGLCQSYEAAYNLESRMREGLSLKQAKESIIQDEYSDGSAECFASIKNEINQSPYAFPLVYRALYKRISR